ncbi:MAG TPA: hypothetical protein DCS82_13330 [Rhodospirillaceae bacterium]|nr:hypothetical protein [Rhodospirillaceae bacterium]HAA92796.1 hypothetical protein [Rhodospirillaceae bacterium]HAT36690.1 hypothetical protein [Rhodospirillaceae bacterium]|tara:strand:+ start:469 stop:897 length:429 start_codon:yes stop_codon:yes gene_type:complete
MAQGYGVLTLSAFLAATIMPFSSEALLLAMAASGDFNSYWLLLFASIGNVFGAVVNWVLGRYSLRWRDHRWFPVSPRRLAQSTDWFNRYGVWSLLFAWVPILGDPLTLAAGLMRVRFWLFLLLVSIAKAGRYAILLGLFEAV